MPNLAIEPWDPNTSNLDILHAAWNNGSTDFRRRIPEPTQANLEQTVRDLVNYTPGYNEFATTLINKVGRTLARENSWTNPFAFLKDGMLEYGESIEEYKTGLIKAHTFDPRRAYGEKALFGRHDIDVQTAYHTINRENMYALTVDHPVLKRAFMSETGLSRFVMSIMEAPTTSDNWDEFLIMADLFRKYEKNGGFFKVHVDSVKGETGAKAFLEVLREYAELLPYISEKYNAAHMPSHANRDDLILFTTPAAKASIDVQGLAALFNVDYGQVPYRVITMPEEFFFGYGAEIQAVLTTKDFFVCVDTYFDIASQPNPAGRYENHFLHHDGIYSVSRFVPAIAFTLGAGTIVLPNTPEPVTALDAITLTDADGNAATQVVRGANYLLSTATDSDDLRAVRFDVSGYKSVYSFDENTGELHVASNDSATQIVVTAYAVDDDEITATRTLNVVGTLVNYWPNPEVVNDADNDGIPEVEPVSPSIADDTVTIPTIKGLQYRKEGVNVNNGSTHVITGETDFDAVARTGYELKPDADATWTFTPGA